MNITWFQLSFPLYNLSQYPSFCEKILCVWIPILLTLCSNEVLCHEALAQYLFLFPWGSFFQKGTFSSFIFFFHPVFLHPYSNSALMPHVSFLSYLFSSGFHLLWESMAESSLILFPDAFICGPSHSKRAVVLGLPCKPQLKGLNQVSWQVEGQWGWAQF